MNVLQICPKPPYPKTDGGCIASLQLGREIMAAGYNLDVLAIATPKHPYRAEAFDKAYHLDTNFQAQFVNTGVTPMVLVKNLFRKTSNWEDRFTSAAFRDFLQHLLTKKTYDFVILDGLMTANYLPVVRRFSKAAVVYRSHNVESAIPAQLSEQAKGRLRQRYLRIQANRLQQFEQRIWEEADHIFSISFTDTRHIADRIKKASRVITLPFGIEPAPLKEKAEKLTVFHLGSMDWKPNIDGIRWFIQSVWPLVRKSLPAATLHLGGKGIQGKVVSNKTENITVHHPVTDAVEFMSDYDVMIVPVMAGSGIRIKVLEGMATGKVIVATEKGVDGVACQNEVSVLLADDTRGFARQVVRALTDEELRSKISSGALELINRQYRPERNIEKIRQIFGVKAKNE